MMKKCISILLCLILCMGFTLTAYAAGNQSVIDQAGLLSESDAQWLTQLVDEVAQKHEIDIVILTVPSLDGKSAQDYADDYYDYNGYREDGVIFLLAMAEREWHISTCGKVIDFLTDDVLYNMEEGFLPYLSEGKYYHAFQDFVNGLDVYMTDDPIGDALVCLMMGSVVGLIVAAIVLLIMRAGMNTKIKQHAAGDYLKAGSYNLTRTQDLFLYSQVSKRRKPEQNNNTRSGGGGSTVHTSSSGRTHGGRGGKF